MDRVFSKYFQVVYEDNHLLVVNKESGILVQGDKTGDTTLLELCKSYIKGKYKKPGAVFLGLVHRLDRPVSGLVIFARTSKALERMNKIFKNRQVTKVYWAIVKNKPKNKEDRLIHWLVKDEKLNKVAAYKSELEGSQRAELSYILRGTLNEHHLLEVRPITGRAHQIRVQLASIKCPIRGDVKYGFPKPNQDASINLHARALKFTHPVKKEDLYLTAGVPRNEFWEQFLTLEKTKPRLKYLN